MNVIFPHTLPSLSLEGQRWKQEWSWFSVCQQPACIISEVINKNLSHMEQCVAFVLLEAHIVRLQDFYQKNQRSQRKSSKQLIKLR